MAARTPPHNLDAERSLLGAMLISRDAITNTADIVTPDAFYKPAHGHVHAAILQLHAQGEPVDAVTVANQLNHLQLLEVVGGPSALTTLISETGSTSNAVKYAHIIADHALLHRLIGAAGEIAEIGYSNPENASAAADRAEKLLFAVTNSRRSRHASRLGDTITAVLDRVEQRAERGGLSGYATEFHDLDQLLLGLQPGQLITLGARPRMGKSTFAGNIAVNIAAQGHPVLIASVEMLLEELQDRYVAAEARVDYQRIRSGRLGPGDYEKLTAGIGRLAPLPIWVEDSSTVGVNAIRSAARQLTAQHGRLGAIVVDYIQLLQTDEKAENRQNAVAQISRSLKMLAVDVEAPVISLSQLSRNLELRADKRPSLADLKDSGAVEADSDVVLFLYRDEVYNPQSQDRGTAEVIVAKQRSGPEGAVHLAFLAPYLRFANMARAA